MQMEGKSRRNSINIHRRHYSSPTICKTSKKLEFHKLSFQKMFRREYNFNLYKTERQVDICGVNSGNLFLHLHRIDLQVGRFEIGA